MNRFLTPLNRFLCQTCIQNTIPNADKGVKWDSQFQNTKAAYAKATDLNSVDSGSQFWDLISKQGSYLSEYDRRSMDAIKIQYDADAQNGMNQRLTAVKSFKLQSYTLNNKYVFEEYKNETHIKDLLFLIKNEHYELEK